MTPDALDVRMNPVNLGVVVQLKFQHEFSNVLTILASVISKGHVSDCIAWISTIPSVSISILQNIAFCIVLLYFIVFGKYFQIDNFHNLDNNNLDK